MLSERLCVMRIFLCVSFSLYLSAQGSIVLQNNFGPAADDIYSISRTLWTLAPFSRAAERSEHSIRNDCGPLFCSHHCWWCGKSANHGAVLCWPSPRAHSMHAAATPQCAPRAAFCCWNSGERRQFAEFRRFRSSTWNRALGFFNVCNKWNKQRGETLMAILCLFWPNLTFTQIVRRTHK